MFPPPQVHMSAVSSLQRDLESLSSRLEEVTVERDRLLMEAGDATAAHEDKIVELHSVIAELSRKLEDQREDMIREESEFDEEEEEEGMMREVSFEEEDDYDEIEGSDNGNAEEDFNSLAFERDLENHTRYTLKPLNFDLECAN